MRQSVETKIANDPVWNQDKLRRMGASVNYKDSLASTIITYLNGEAPKSTVNSTGGAFKFRKTSKRKKSIDKCLRKLAKEADEGLSDSQKLFEKSRPSNSQMVESRAMTAESGTKRSEINLNELSKQLPESIGETQISAEMTKRDTKRDEAAKTESVTQ